MNASSHSPKRPAVLPANSAAHPPLTLTVLPLTGARVHADKTGQREAHDDAYNPLWPMAYAMAVFFALIAALASID